MKFFKYIALCLILVSSNAFAFNGYYDEKDDIYLISEKRLQGKLSEAQSTNDPRLLFTIGYYYEYGRLKDDKVKNPKKRAIKWYKKAAKYEHVPSLARIGKLYRELGSYKNGISYLNRAVNKENHPIATYELGVAYQKGEGVFKNLGKAFKYYEKSAKAGYAKAEYKLADFYMKGIGVEKDLLKAAEYNERIANRITRKELKIPLAIRIANLYQSIDAEKFKEDIFYWHKIAGLAGDSYSMIYIANAYSNGNGVEMDNEKAVKWYLNAARLGNIHAMDHLGYIYTNGLNGLDQDLTQAIKWFSNSADNGSPTAAWNMGYFYYNGYGVPRNLKESQRWFKRAKVLSLYNRTEGKINTD